jgi:uncharacterized protein
MSIQIENNNLQTLIRLQELDLQTSQLETKVQGVPAELSALERDLASNKKKLEDVQAGVESSRRERRRLEAEVEDLRQKLSRYKTQLMEVKTNEAYQAMLEEIEFCERKIQEKEDQVLEEMVATDEWKEQIRASEKEFEEKQKAFQARKAELETFARESEAQLEQMRSEREEVKARIPSELADLYVRIASARNGLAIVGVKDASCEGCHVRLRPQLYAEVRTNQRIITCENCNRVLYYASG